MRRVVAVAVACCMIVAFAGCAFYDAPVKPPQGAFTSIQAPVSTDFNEATQKGTQQGMSASHSVLGLIAWGDASVDTAAENGNVSSINYVDYRFLSVLGIYTKYTTVVHGK